jgi:drug/metabolite transporter (DMT)-like permease
MPPLPLILLLAAAGCHAAWNLLAKRTAGSRDWIFTWGVLGAGIVFAPSLLLQPLPPGAWSFVLVSAAAETLYFYLLARAYDRADLSLVYPLARGSAPVLTALIAVILLHEHLAPAGVAGIAVIAAGIGLCGLPARGSRSAASSGAGIALAIGATIAGYTTIDALAIRQAPLVAYTDAVFLLGGAGMLALHARRHGAGAAREALRAHWRVAAAVGLLMLAAYTLVLAAYRLAHLAYAAAVREVSIPLAAAAAALWLKEPFGRRRMAGALAILAGIALIALSRS